MLLEAVLHVFEALERAGVRYAVFSGLAMAAHGFHRATRDLDLFLTPDDVNAQRLDDVRRGAFGFPVERVPDVPIRRYRDVAEMPDPPRKSSALEGLRAACEASELAAAMGTTRVLPRGVKKFRSIEAMDADREAWETGTHDASPPDGRTSD